MVPHARRCRPQVAERRRLLALFAGCFSLAFSGPLLAALQRLDDGVALELGAYRLEVRACREDAFRVLYAPPGDFFARRSLATVPGACRPTEIELQIGEDHVALHTRRLTARIELPGGAIRFLDRQGRTLLAETEHGKLLEPAEVMGERTFHVRAEWEPAAGEALYGLGSHQNGLMSYSGHDVDLYQSNTVAVVPFLVSSRGYGVLWDNTSHSRFGDLASPVAVPATHLLDSGGQRGGLIGTYRQGDCQRGTVVATRRDAEIAFGAAEDRPPVSAIHNAPQATNRDVHPALQPGEVCVTWEGHLESGDAGPYDLLTFSNNGLRLWWDDELVIDTFRQGWLPWWDQLRFDLGAKERHRLTIEWRREDTEGTLRLKWKPPPRSSTTSLWSEVGDGIAYTFVYGPDLDDVVASYRELTGRAPLMPRWALGLWQSRERYQTAQESLDVLAQFRRRGIPLDVIVQDWQYWRPDEWGSHQFDPPRFPDPTGWIRQIHQQFDARLMISVWPKFYPGTANFDAMKERGFLYPETLKRPTTDWLGNVHTFYDAFNPGARALFWEQLDQALFRRGVDAWWLDASEPELVGEGTAAALVAAMHPTALGSGARMANAYALVNSQAIYEGQRQSDPNRRVFILTRSAFLGIQRYASATWTGDVSADWESLRRQIPAGLNFSLSGVPWWTTDVGGFTVRRRWAGPDPKPEDVEEWRELVTRWFQFATFCPLLRVHGQFPHREMWWFGADDGHPAFSTQLAFDRLRYRLLPYTYSLAAGVTRHHGTIMRPLVMDFRDDPEVLEIGDQFLFGPSLLVSPVTHYGARTRHVYLPHGAAWYDFWSGVRHPGRQHLEAPAPYDRLPLYVRAGSILPFGPELQHTGERPADPLTLWVYTGADADFELYEDDGTSNDYERGAFATIPLHWDEAHRALTLGEQTGAFPGQLKSRRVRVVFVSSSRALGHTPDPPIDCEVQYDGTPVTVQQSATSGGR